MLDWYKLEYYQRTRYEELMHAAEQQRRVHAALGGRPRHHRIRGRLGRGLIWLGSQLVTWGGWLQARGPASASSA